MSDTPLKQEGGGKKLTTPILRSCNLTPALVPPSCLRVANDTIELRGALLPPDTEVPAE
jgi:hypothetical protein